MTSPYAIPRKSDGTVMLPRAQEVTMFNYDFATLSAMPPELTGGGIISGARGEGFMALWTNSSGGSSTFEASDVYDMSRYEYIWMKVQLRVIGTNKGDDCRIGFLNGTDGCQWYTGTQRFSSLNGDDPITTGPLFDFTTSRGGYREVGILAFPGRKVAAATDGNKIVNGGYFPNMTFGPGDQAVITTKGSLADVKRLDIMKWTCVGGHT